MACPFSRMSVSPFLLCIIFLNPSTPTFLFPRFLFFHVFFKHFLRTRIVKNKEILKKNPTQMNYIHLYNPTKATNFISCSTSSDSHLGTLICVLFLFLLTHKLTKTTIPQPSYMNDLEACTLTICHLPWLCSGPPSGCWPCMLMPSG